MVGTALSVTPKFGTTEVDITMEPLEGGGIQMEIGTMTVLLFEDPGLLEESLGPEVRQGVLEQLEPLLFTGNVTGKRCEAIFFISEDWKKIEGNIDCPNQHLVVETIKKKHKSKFILHRKLQTPRTRFHLEDIPPSPNNEKKFCTLFIHTDPFFWRHIRVGEGSDDRARRKILQIMVGHVIAANKMYGKVTFHGGNFTHEAVQFVLSGFQIDDDADCDEVEEIEDVVDDEVDYSLEGEYDSEDPTGLFEGVEYTEEEYDNYDDSGFINDDDDEYGDWDNSTDFEQILELTRDPFNKSESLNGTTEDYEDYDYDTYTEWDYEEAAGHPDYDDYISPNSDECYENINGTINPSTEFCKSFDFHSSGQFLNLFSTVDHSAYCMAHIWTYRDFDVVGLADNPTEDSPGLSGYCAWYDPDCSMGFNTGLVTFRHLGNRLSLADSQETFIHELGHSMGADHDPKEGGKCSPGGDKGNYVMYPGPIGNSHVRREFSQCSMEEIGRALEETEHSCLVTREELEKVDMDAEGDLNDTTVEPITDAHVENVSEEQVHCSSTKLINFLNKARGYTKDLKEYFEDGDVRKIYFRLSKKNKIIVDALQDDDELDEHIKTLIEKYLVKLKKSVKNLDDELTRFIGRKITKLVKSISKCISLV